MTSDVRCTCKKLEPAPGSVFLNKSSASSSFRILIVSAKATTSWARIFFSSSWMPVFSAQIFSKLLILSECIRRVTRISFHGGDLHTQLANAAHLRLDHLGEGRHFLRLRMHERPEVLHGRLFRGDHLLFVGIHSVTHLLEDSD